jgi:hypothetical protein
MDTAFDRPTGVAYASFEGIAQFGKLFSSGTLPPTKMAGLHTLKESAERGRRSINSAKPDPSAKAAIEKYGTGINAFYKTFLRKNLEKPDIVSYKMDLGNEISASEGETEGEEENVSSAKASSGVVPERGVPEGVVPEEEEEEQPFEETKQERKKRLQRERRARKKAEAAAAKAAESGSESSTPQSLIPKKRGKKQTKASKAIAQELRGGGGSY